MAGKHRPYVKKKFESTGLSSDTSANLYMSMLTSPAFKELTPRQVRLYVYCKAQYYGEKRKVRDDCFTMNRSKWCDLYELYDRNNQTRFYRDISRLIEVGLIDCVECGADTRTKSVYRFSARWQKYGTDEFTVPADCKTISMAGTRKRKKQ